MVVVVGEFPLQREQVELRSVSLLACDNLVSVTKVFKNSEFAHSLPLLAML